jgi:hypothetical protein
MPPEFERAPDPLTPRFWAELESRLTEQAHASVWAPDVPETPEFERAVGRALATVPPPAAEPSFPRWAAATMVAIMALVGLFLGLAPSAGGPATVASPGAVQAAPEVEQVSAEAMVVASFRRFADPRTEGERMEQDFRSRGYDVVVEHRRVTDPNEEGRVLEIRHASVTGGGTLSSQDVRGPLILVVAISGTDAPVS